MKENIGMHLKYENRAGVDCFIRITDYCFDGNFWVKSHDRVAPKGRVYTLKCTCGSNNWTENGRFIGEMECGCCGKYVQITQSEK